MDTPLEKNIIKSFSFDNEIKINNNLKSINNKILENVLSD